MEWKCKYIHAQNPSELQDGQLEGAGPVCRVRLRRENRVGRLQCRRRQHTGNLSSLVWNRKPLDTDQLRPEVLGLIFMHPRGN